MKLNTTLNYLNKHIPEKPHLAIILGSGLGGFSQNLQHSKTIPYCRLPNYPTSTVAGHKGEWIFGYIYDIPILCASGRFHLYEGFNIKEVSILVSSLQKLDCKKLIITNSSGCLNAHWNIGDFMFIDGYIDYTFKFNKDKPKIIKINNSNKIFNNIYSIGKELNINVRKGIYAWTLGPTYETPAEVQDIISLGGNAVGMSTVPEIMKAIEYNMDITGLACLTNYGSGLENKKLLHSDVLKVSNHRNKMFSQLLKKIIKINTHMDV